MDYLLLALLWILWCSLHSGLIALSVRNALREKLGGWDRYYRLAYNIFALATLLPVYFYFRAIESTIVFTWQGGWHLLQAVCILIAIILLAGGARSYDLPTFFGIRQAKDGTPSATLSSSDELDTTGVLGFVRHPWYLGGILLLWSYRLEYSLAAIITSGILSGYLIIGALLEERKLLIQFGDEYRRYRHRVPMLLPFKRIAGALTHVFHQLRRLARQGDL